jgi:HK97 family phage prohead protease
VSQRDLKHLGRPFEVKSLDDKAGTFTGYGSVFGVEDSYLDIVMPGAFAKTLQKRTPAMLWQHDSRTPIGVWTKATEDQKGLYLEGRLALKTQSGAEAYELLRMGALDGLSIGFRTIQYEYDSKTDVRKLLELELYEVSPVTFPALDVARVDGVKAESAPSIRDLEAALRDAGLSRSDAKALLATGVKALDLRDADQVLKSALSDAVTSIIHTQIRRSVA